MFPALVTVARDGKEIPSLSITERTLGAVGGAVGIGRVLRQDCRTDQRGRA